MNYYKTAFVSLSILIVMILSGCSEAQSQARDRNCFHHRHYNTGGVCLLSSYGFLLEYANSSDDHIAPFDNFDMMSEYMRFHNEYEPCPQHSAAHFRTNQKDDETELSKAINGYCIARGWSGYKRVLQFHDWVKSNFNWADNIKFVKRMPETLNSNGRPLPNGYSQIASFLERNSNPDSRYDYAALICFATPSGPHSVFLGYDNDYFIRDSNHFDRFADKNCSFGFSYGPDADIYEYVIFKIKRVRLPQNEWMPYRASAFKANKTEGDNFRVLEKPIPLKHMRVTNETVGADGTNCYTDIKIRSKSDPNFEITYGVYYGVPGLNINNNFMQIGHRTANGVYEFDLGQIANDLYIWGYQPNFNFNRFSYQ